MGSELPVVPEFRDDVTLGHLGRAEASTAEDPEGGPLKSRPYGTFLPLREELLQTWFDLLSALNLH